MALLDTHGRVRPLQHSDVADALELSTAAGWNQTAEDWSRLISLEPEACFGVESGGRVVATTTLLCHDASLAWVGMVLTHSDFRKRGYARVLMDEAMRTAQSRAMRCVKLDATDQGEPLYRSLGFEAEQTVERWLREPTPFDEGAEGVRRGEVPVELDAAGFGVSRERFLRGLGSALLLDGGYALERPGCRARYFGPCVATTPGVAERLARSAIAERSGEAWFWDILAENRAAVRIAESLGFRRVRQLARMRVGDPVRGDDSLVYAIAGFEAG